MAKKRQMGPVIQFELAKKMAHYAKVLEHKENPGIADKLATLIIERLRAGDNATLAEAIRITKTYQEERELEKQVFWYATHQVYANSETDEKYRVLLMLFPITVLARGWKKPRRVTLACDPDDAFLHTTPAALRADTVALRVHPRFLTHAELTELEFSDLLDLTKILGPGDMPDTAPTLPVPLGKAPLVLEVPPESLVEAAVFAVAGLSYRDDKEDPLEGDEDELVDWLDNVDARLSAALGANAEVMRPADFLTTYTWNDYALLAHRATVQAGLALLDHAVAPGDAVGYLSAQINMERRIELRFAIYRKAGTDVPLCACRWRIDDFFTLPAYFQAAKDTLEDIGLSSVDLRDEPQLDDRCACCGHRLFPGPNGFTHAESIDLAGETEECAGAQAEADGSEHETKSIPHNGIAARRP